MKRELLLLGALTALLCATGHAQTPYPNPPLLHLSFDNVSGTTVNNDGSGGAALNGTLTGTAVITNGGKFGANALYVSGVNNSDGYVLVNDPVVPLNVSAGKNWTVALWFKTTTAGGVFGYQGDGAWANGNTTLYLTSGSYLTTGSKVGAVRWGQGNEAGTTSGLNDGNWHHFAMTCNNGTRAIYLDGNPDPLSIDQWGGNGGVGTGGQFWIGGAGDPDDGGHNLNGYIDEVYVYDGPLSPSQIELLYLNNSTISTNLTVSAAVNPTTIPASITAGQPITVTATVTPTVGTVTNVSVNLTTIGGPSAASLVLSDTTNVYTNTFTVPAWTPVGNYRIVIKAQDTTPATALGSAAILVVSLPSLPVGPIGSDTSLNTGNSNYRPVGGDAGSVTFDSTVAPSTGDILGSVLFSYNFDTSSSDPNDFQYAVEANYADGYGNAHGPTGEFYGGYYASIDFDIKYDVNSTYPLSQPYGGGPLQVGLDAGYGGTISYTNFDFTAISDGHWHHISVPIDPANPPAWLSNPPNGALNNGYCWGALFNVNHTGLPGFGVSGTLNFWAANIVIKAQATPPTASGSPLVIGPAGKDAGLNNTDNNWRPTAGNPTVTLDTNTVAPSGYANGSTYIQWSYDGTSRLEIQDDYGDDYGNAQGPSGEFNGSQYASIQFDLKYDISSTLSSAYLGGQGGLQIDLRAGYGNRSAGQYVDLTTLADGKWHHITVPVDQATAPSGAWGVELVIDHSNDGAPAGTTQNFWVANIAAFPGVQTPTPTLTLTATNQIVGLSWHSVYSYYYPITSTTLRLPRPTWGAVAGPVQKGLINRSQLVNAVGNSGFFTLASLPGVRLQVLLPGETNAPGTLTGKLGTPLPYTGNPVVVTVNEVDANYNIVNSGDPLVIDNYVPDNPPVHLKGGTWSGAVYTDEAYGPNATVTAHDGYNTNILSNTSSPFPN